MKTAISIPDETFAKVDARAKQLGVSRSEFFVTAARKFLEETGSEEITSEINQAIQCVGRGENEEFLRAASRATLRDSQS